MFKHRKNCPCAVCTGKFKGLTEEEAVKRAIAWHEEKLKEYGWIVHMVADDPTSPTGFNAHTHGLAENFSHPDLQQVIYVTQLTNYGVFAGIVARVKEGERYGHGDVLEGILTNPYKCKVINAAECGRPVLRIILPDVQGNIDRGRLKDVYRLQYKVL